MSSDPKLIFSFTISDGAAVKKLVNFLRRMLRSIPFRISSEGLFINQLVPKILYSETSIRRNELLGFYIDPELFSNKNHPLGASHIFTLELDRVKSVAASINKKDNVKIWQFWNNPKIFIGVGKGKDANQNYDEIQPINEPFPINSSRDFDMKNHHSNVDCASLLSYIKGLTKRSIKEITMECYKDSIFCKGETSGGSCRYDFKIPQTEHRDSEILFERTLSSNTLKTISELCGIHPQGVVKFYISVKNHLIGMAFPVGSLGDSLLHLLPQEVKDEEDDENETEIFDLDELESPVSSSEPPVSEEKRRK